MTTLSPEAPAVTSPSDPAPDPADPAADPAADPTPAAPAKPFEGLTVIVTGDVEGFTRDSANAAIAFLGGKPVASVSGKTGLVIMGEGAGVSKMGKARDHNLNVITGEAFSALAHAFRDGTWDGKPVGEPVRDYDRRTDPQPEPDPVAHIPFNERHNVGKAHTSTANSAGRFVREIRQWCSCGHGWLGRDPEGEPCPVELGICEPQPLWPWDEPGYEPFWPPRESDAAPAEFYEVIAVLEAERIAALPKSTIGTSNDSTDDEPAPAAAPALVAAASGTEPAPVPPTPAAPAPAAQAEPIPTPAPAPTPEPVVEPAGFVDESWSTERDEPRGRRRTPPPPMDDFWPIEGDLDHGSFEPEDDGFDTSTWDTAPATTPSGSTSPAPAPAEPEPAPEPVAPPEPVKGARRLTTDDVDALLALRGNTEPSQEERILEVALLNSPANRVHAITETTPAHGTTPETERLLAIAVLMTDGLTKAVLTDIAVAPGADRYLADEAIAAAVDMLPDYIQAIVFCRADKTATYAQHGFEAAPGFAVMFR
jgi:hypothetical protein